MFQLDIIYQDDSILVINKPPNLVVSPTETQSIETLADILKSQFNINLDRAGIVHRLDKDTSGILLVAKTAQSLEKLQSQFKNREVSKQYTTLVHGHTPPSGVIEGGIIRNPGDREKFIVSVEGKEAKTSYKLLKHLYMSDEKIGELFPDYSKIQLKKLTTSNYQRFSLLVCQPYTGRTHQLRVHLKHIGFPIVGDSKYSGRKTIRLDHRWCSRQFLHASKIKFTHPETSKLLEFESPLPKDLSDSLQFLELVKN